MTKKQTIGNSYKAMFTIKTKNSLSLEELYQMMKKHSFPLGQPELMATEKKPYLYFEMNGEKMVHISVKKSKIIIRRYASVEYGLRAFVGDMLTDCYYSLLEGGHFDVNYQIFLVTEELKAILKQEG